MSSRENVTTQSPARTSRQPSSGSGCTASGVRRSYVLSSKESPVRSHIFATSAAASKAPQTWSSRASRPCTARVHACPRSGDPIIWISSTTATSQTARTLTISIVQAACVANGTSRRSWPVKRLQ